MAEVIEVKSRKKSIPEICEEIANEMCDKYCKWPDQWDVEKEGIELYESDICSNCPICRLMV